MHLAIGNRTEDKYALEGLDEETAFRETVRRYDVTFSAIKLATFATESAWRECPHLSAWTWIILARILLFRCFHQEHFVLS
jgi:hypothetical protein